MSIFKKCSCSQDATILETVDEEAKRELDEAIVSIFIVKLGSRTVY